MKNILLICLLSICYQAAAEMAAPPEICRDNKWTVVFANKSNSDYLKKRRNYPTLFCILPNGDYYNLYDLEIHKDTKFKHLIEQYSGKAPTIEQFKQVKDKIREQGYTVN